DVDLAQPGTPVGWRIADYRTGTRPGPGLRAIGRAGGARTGPAASPVAAGKAADPPMPPPGGETHTGAETRGAPEGGTMSVALRDVEAMRTELERVDAVARSVDEWLARMVEGLRPHFPIDRAALRVVDPEDGEAVVVGQYVEHPTAIPVGTRVPYRATSFPRADRERRPIMSVGEDREFPLPPVDAILWEE